MPIARSRPQSWQARVCLRDTRNGSKPKVELLAPPVHDLVRALVRDTKLPRQLRLRDAGNMAGADESIAFGRLARLCTWIAT